MVNLQSAVEKINTNLKILAIGDVMVDLYTEGEVHRISPEAPVPILHAKQEKMILGGAGNLMASVLALNAHVIPMSQVGADPYGEIIKTLFKKDDLSTDTLFVNTEYITPVKHRFIAQGQQLMRVDTEKVTPIDPEFEETVKQSLTNLIPLVDGIILSDYGKGLLTSTLLAFILLLAKKHGVPTLVDPKGLDFTKYANATLIKPNEKEARIAANLPNNAPLEAVAEQLLSTTYAEYLVITRSEKGIALFEKGQKRVDISAETHEVTDVTGAGDTVLAILATAFLSGLSIQDSASLANLGASLAIQHLGCAKISLDQLKDTIFHKHHKDRSEKMLYR